MKLFYKSLLLSIMGLSIVFSARAQPQLTSSQISVANHFQGNEGAWNNTSNGLSSSIGGGQILVGTAIQSGIVGGRASSGIGISAWQNTQWNTAFDQKWNLHSTQDFLNNKDAQRDAIVTVAAGNYRDLGDTSGLIGKNVHGVTMNDATLMECAYVLGGGGCRSYVNNPDGSMSGTASRNGVDRRMSGAANLDVSSVTGREGQAGGGTAINQTTGQAETPLTPAIAGLFCDPQILSSIQTLGAQEVDRRMALATDARTGFSTLNGNGVLAAAGLNALSGGSGYSGGGGSSGGSSSFFSMSCLDKILNSGLSNIYNPPSWSQIKNMLIQAAQNLICAEANKLFQQVTQPLSQALYKNIGVGGFSPGLASILGQAGLPTSISLGGRMNIIQGPDGGLISLEDRFNGMMRNSGNSSSITLPSKLFGQ